VQSKYVLFVGVAALSWLAAELSYRLIERRFLVLKKQFSHVNESVTSLIDTEAAAVKM
jgi:peptidoglycan/LPS O-acetylase OafA/YrhL